MGTWRTRSWREEGDVTSLSNDASDGLSRWIASLRRSSRATRTFQRGRHSMVVMRRPNGVM